MRLSRKFPINRCHQRVVTKKQSYLVTAFWSGFPINRCHQRVVTFTEELLIKAVLGFQSIGVTSEW